MEPSLIQEITKRLSLHQPISLRSVGGGSINQTYKLQSGSQGWFCKVASAAAFPGLFQNEASGLNTIRRQRVIAVPEIVDRFVYNDWQVLLMEWITEGTHTKAFWQTFGEKLAALHRVTHPFFGFDENNYMGTIPQQNDWQPDWVLFFRQQRLEPMIERCAAGRQLSPNHQAQFDKLYQRLPAIFNKEPSSLLHGDLWSGNFMCNAAGNPVLIDPAVYYGHRSVDLAMTTLFGGFDAAFFESYNHHFPLPYNRREQQAVANLYPLLIHLYLFGSGYLPQIERTLSRFA